MPQNLSANSKQYSGVGGYSTSTGIIGGYTTPVIPGYLNTNPPLQAMVMQWVFDELKTVLTGEENGQRVNLELTPERNISAYEQFCITSLITAIVGGCCPSPVALMSYVRKHNLERHFKFSVA